MSYWKVGRGKHLFMEGHLLGLVDSEQEQKQEEEEEEEQEEQEQEEQEEQEVEGGYPVQFVAQNI